MTTRTFSLILALVSLAGCDSQEPFRVGVGFGDDPPLPVIAGKSFAVQAIGTTDGTFESAKILVFRGEATHDTNLGLTGDTLTVIPLNIDPGTDSFDVTATVMVPAEAVTQPEEGSIYIEFRNGECRSGCIGSTGSSLELVPSR